MNCSNEFLFAIVGGLTQTTLLLPGDYFVREDEEVPDKVVLIEKGVLEVMSDGKCIRTMERGDVIGKRWLLQAKDEESKDCKNDHDCIRAHTPCTLLSGLDDVESLVDLTMRYPKDFTILRADRSRINSRRHDRNARFRHAVHLTLDTIRATTREHTSDGE
jgi:hypothetical protein